MMMILKFYAEKIFKFIYLIAKKKIIYDIRKPTQ